MCLWKEPFWANSCMYERIYIKFVPFPIRKLVTLKTAFFKRPPLSCYIIDTLWTIVSFLVHVGAAPVTLKTAFLKRPQVFFYVIDIRLTIFLIFLFLFSYRYDSVGIDSGRWFNFDTKKGLALFFLLYWQLYNPCYGILMYIVI